MGRTGSAFTLLVALAVPAAGYPQPAPDNRDPRYLGHTSPKYPCEWRPLHGNCQVEGVEWQKRNHSSVRIFVSMRGENSCRRVVYRLEWPNGNVSEQTTYVYGNDAWRIDDFLSVDLPKEQPKFFPVTCEVGYPGRPSGGYPELGPDGQPVAGPPPVVHPNPSIDLIRREGQVIVATYAPYADEDPYPATPNATPTPPRQASTPAAVEKKEDKPSGFSNFMSRWGTTIVGVAAGIIATGKTGADPRAARQIVETLNQQQAAGAGGGDVVASSDGPLSADCEEASKQATAKIAPFTRSHPISAGDSVMNCRNQRAHTSFYESTGSSLQSSCGADHQNVQGFRRLATNSRSAENRVCR
jgi:hypothetical protein